MKTSQRSPIPQTKELHFTWLRNTPVFDQLQLEESLLRAGDGNHCIVNIGSPRAIVMGISGKPSDLLDISLVKKDQIPVFQRYSGGGTVIVDEQTLFVTFILSKNAIDIHPFPEPILRWSADIYADAWQIPGFRLQENDYTIHDKKCGGNAQYITKERWLHHTSFLWDYSTENMRYLLLPQKRPQYRRDRSHGEFLCKLRDCSAPVDILIERLKKTLAERFTLKEFELGSWKAGPHRKATRQLALSTITSKNSK